jgi:hypothetical protein
MDCRVAALLAMTTLENETARLGAGQFLTPSGTRPVYSAGMARGGATGDLPLAISSSTQSE